MFFHGDHEESDKYPKISEDPASPDDVATQAVWRGTRARLLVIAGDGNRDHLASSAVAIVSATDSSGCTAMPCSTALPCFQLLAWTTRRYRTWTRLRACTSERASRRRSRPCGGRTAHWPSNRVTAERNALNSGSSGDECAARGPQPQTARAPVWTPSSSSRVSMSRPLMAMVTNTEPQLGGDEV